MLELSNKTILITGGTGSFGHAAVEMLLKKHVAKIIIYSRDEMKQWAMAQRFDDQRLRFFIGDVRDKDRLKTALRGVDIVIHAAATKIVPIAEYNPIECLKTNVFGASNLVEACIETDVEAVVALSTDKASSPANLYGASKLASDKLFIAANNYSGVDNCKFAVVRYGNVMGSRGSVIPLFLKLAKDGKPLSITDRDMTRFMITLEEGVNLVFHAISDMIGGEIYVKKIPSMKVIDIAKAISPEAEIVDIGIRPGEKLHEEMISLQDSEFTFEYEDHYKILPMINNWHKDTNRIGDGVAVGNSFSYTSDNNKVWLTGKQLIAWVKAEGDKIL